MYLHLGTQTFRDALRDIRHVDGVIYRIVQDQAFRGPIIARFYGHIENLLEFSYRQIRQVFAARVLQTARSARIVCELRSLYSPLARY